MKTAFFIYDTTANTGKHFINNDSNQNQESTENALAFKTKAEAEKYISECKLTWAAVIEEELTGGRKENW